MTVSPEMAQAVIDRSTSFADQLRRAADGHAKVPSLDWSVTELGRHVAGLPQF